MWRTTTREAGGPGRRTTWKCEARGADTSLAFLLAARCLTIRGRRPLGHSSRGTVGPACRRFAPAPLRLLGASSVCGLVRKSPRLVCAGAVCWPPAPPWSRSRACLSWRWRGSPPAAGRVPALALASPPRWGALCGACRGAGGRRSAGAGGSYLPPSAPGLAQLLRHGACGGGGAICWAGAAPGHKILRQVRPLPPGPLPPPGGGGKRGITGRKIVTKETQEGC